MYNIRYIKLNFTVEILRQCTLPYFKNSALRGGMGRMLMEFSCIGDENCDLCNEKEECIVNKVMYPKFKIQPNFIADSKSVGYIIQCLDKKQHYKKGDRLNFSVTLLGETTKYVDYFIYSFDALGCKGLGSKDGKYKIISVKDDDGVIIFANGEIEKHNIFIKTLEDYVKRRYGQIVNRPQIMMNIVTPLRYKLKGQYKNNIDYKDLLIALNRRIEVLNCFEGNSYGGAIECDENFIVESNLEWKENTRYSSRQKTKMKLGGIEGRIDLYCNNDKVIELLCAGEIIHIGKNTSFGLGKYILY